MDWRWLRAGIGLVAALSVSGCPWDDEDVSVGDDAGARADGLVVADARVADAAPTPDAGRADQQAVPDGAGSAKGWLVGIGGAGSHERSIDEVVDARGTIHVLGPFDETVTVGKTATTCPGGRCAMVVRFSAA